MGTATVIVGSSFYLSSIYAGYEAIKRYNSLLDMRAKKKLQDIPIRLDLLKIIWD